MMSPSHARIIFAAAVMVLVSSGTASAQNLGLWGGWNDYGRGWQGSAPGATANPPRYGLFSGGTGEAFPALMDGGARPLIQPEAPDIVWFPNTEQPGTVLIDNAARRLYLTIDRENAYEYPISVGRDGFTWTGTETVSRIAEWPDWHPPEEMRVRDPRLPVKMTGGIKNPLGAVSIYLGKSLYRIHGTNDPKTIGYAASSGCFRMLNVHALHLASQVSLGTVVKVVDRLEMPIGDASEELPWLTETQPAVFDGRAG